MPYFCSLVSGWPHAIDRAVPTRPGVPTYVAAGPIRAPVVESPII
jgi:hypothetical protein